MTTTSFSSTLTVELLQCWEESRKIFTDQLERMKKDDLKKQMPNTMDSVGFIVRRIGDVELFFARKIFGRRMIKPAADIRITQYDSGEYVNLEKLKTYIKFAGEAVRDEIRHQNDTNWEEIVYCPEFGKKTKAKFLGTLIAQTAFQTGIIKNILEYGIIPPRYNPNMFALYEKTSA
jgi:hypothetical protein